MPWGKYGGEEANCDQENVQRSTPKAFAHHGGQAEQAFNTQRSMRKTGKTFNSESFRSSAKRLLLYGTPVPARNFTEEMSVLLMEPSTTTSSRKLAAPTTPFTGAPDCCFV